MWESRGEEGFMTRVTSGFLEGDIATDNPFEVAAVGADKQRTFLVEGLGASGDAAMTGRNTMFDRRAIIALGAATLAAPPARARGCSHR